VESGDFHAVLLTGQEDIGAADSLRQAQGLLGSGYWNDGPRAVAERRTHAGRSAQDVDDEHRSALHLTGNQACRGEDCVDPHDSGRKR
jgi:hypothetical protein